MTAQQRAAAATEAVWASVDAGERATLVNSPPGAGKSTLVREIGRRSAVKGQIPILVQTNEQADDLVRGFLSDLDRGVGEGLVVGRLHKEHYPIPRDLAGDPRVLSAHEVRDLHGCDVIVTTGHKWAFSGLGRDFAIIDEAYHLTRAT